MASAQSLERGVDAVRRVQAAGGDSVQLLVVYVVHRSQKVDDELGQLPGSLHHH